MTFIDPGSIEHAIERDEVLRSIRDRVGFRTLIITTALQMLTGAVLIWTDAAYAPGVWLLFAGICSMIILSIVEWRIGIRSAAKESLNIRTTQSNCGDMKAT